MSVTLENSGSQPYACKCLNFQIRPVPTQTVSTEVITDSDFIPVFVGDEGIVAAHPQVTVRTRTRGTSIPGTSRFSRYTTITCLICDLLVYRVYQVYSREVEGKDGPMLPSDDWVERDVMKSLTGWIEVHKQCLTGDALIRAWSSPDYSNIFSLLLPPPLSPQSSAEAIFERPTSPSSSPSPPPATPITYLSSLRPLFLPPPFTPSHPVFTHISSLANEQSQTTRAAAENAIAEFIQTKVSEIENADAELRSNVDRLWQSFRQGLHRIQKERIPFASQRDSTIRSSTDGVRGTTSGTPVTDRSFVPAPVQPSGMSPSPAPRPSALSASLATTKFHHPRARAELVSISGRSLSVASNGSSDSLTSGSSTLVLPPPSESTNNVLKFKRNINDTINTAASYRYFRNLEEDIARHQRGRQKEASRKIEELDQRSGPSRIADNSNSNSNENKNQRSESQPGVTESVPPIRSQEDEVPSSRGRDKGKRKVTFDVQPEIVTIKREVNAENEEEDALANQEPRELIFELEDLEGEGNEVISSKTSLPLLEQPVPPARPRKPRHNTGLSESFSGLRPASLPAPSHVRPPRSQHGSDVSTHMILSLPRPSPPRVERPVAIWPKETNEAEETHNSGVRKTTAADAPSLRGAWTPEGKGWQTFTHRQDSEDHYDKDIPEECDESRDVLGIGIAESNRPFKPRNLYYGNDDAGDKLYDNDPVFVGSLPIAIKAVKRREVLTIASYRPTSGLPEQANPLPPNGKKSVSSTALRRALYAERDLSRSVDPGPLDFAAEESDGEEEEEEANEDLEKLGTADPGGKGRKKALKILVARSEVPGAGMWRSLAS